MSSVTPAQQPPTTEMNKQQAKSNNNNNNNRDATGPSKRAGASKNKKKSATGSTHHSGHFHSSSPSGPLGGSSRTWSSPSGPVPPRDHQNTVPVFGPSVRPSLPQFVDLRTNKGYMTPFEMPVRETGEASPTLAPAASPFPGSPLMSAMSSASAGAVPSPMQMSSPLSGMPFPRHSNSSHALNPQPTSLPAHLSRATNGAPLPSTSMPETPLRVPAASQRHDGPVSPSPRPCPPDHVANCAKILYRTGENGNWSEAPSQVLFSGSHSLSFSMSKSATESMEPNVSKDLNLAMQTAEASEEAVRVVTKRGKRTSESAVMASLGSNNHSPNASATLIDNTNISNNNNNNGVSSNTSNASPTPGNLFQDCAPNSSFNTKPPHGQNARQNHRRSAQQSSPSSVEEDSAAALSASCRSQPIMDRKNSTEPSQQGQFYSVVVEGHFGQVSKIYSRRLLSIGTHVLFEGDRGTDMGFVISCEPIDTPPENNHNNCGRGGRGKDSTHNVIAEASEKEIQCWREIQTAEAEETLAACRNLVAEKIQCPLDIVGAAFQFDKKKLTFYYKTPEQRVDFRSILTPLYSMFHCRIWMERAIESTEA